MCRPGFFLHVLLSCSFNVFWLVHTFSFIIICFQNRADPLVSGYMFARRSTQTFGRLQYIVIDNVFSSFGDFFIEKAIHLYIAELSIFLGLKYHYYFCDMNVFFHKRLKVLFCVIVFAWRSGARV